MIANQAMPSTPADRPPQSPLSFIESLSLAGVSLAVLFTLSCVLSHYGVEHQRYKFIEYGAFCLQLPLALIWLAAAKRGPSGLLSRAASIVALLACVAYVFFPPDLFCLIAAAVQVAIAVGWDRLKSFAASPKEHLKGVWSAGGGFLVALAAWTTAIRLSWWRDFVEQIGVSAYYFVTFLLAFALVAAVFYGQATRAREGKLALAGLRLWDCLVVCLIGLASLRTEGLFGEVAFHHWGVFVAPAQMVRQGGWLLWDVPAQYGFLSTLTLAALPVASVWTTLYFATAGCQAITASFVYFVLKGGSPNPVRPLLAAIATLATVFLLPSMFEGMVGPQIYPSTESFRFIWVYATFAMVLWSYRRLDRNQDIRLPLLLGSIFWFAGMLWSFESAFDTSATWLPAYYLFLWQRGGAPSAGQPAPHRSPAGWVFLPVVLLLAGIGAIDSIYAHGLRHLPDWPAFMEYARAFKNGFGEIPLDLHGAIWVVFICGIAPASVGLALFRQSRQEPGVPLALSAAGMVIATASYCMGRSHPNNILNIMTFCILAASIAVQLAERVRGASSLLSIARYSIVPVFIVVIASCVNSPAVMGHWFATTLTGPRSQVDSLLPRLGAEPEGLLAAHVERSEPVFLLDLNMLPAEPSLGEAGVRPYATPLGPAAAIEPLPQWRTQVYLSRFATRAHRGVWVLIPRANLLDPREVGSLLQSLQSRYSPGQEFQSPHFVLRYFAYRESKSASQ